MNDDGRHEAMGTCSPTLGALAAALAKAQGAMKSAKKDGLNPHFKSRYADLASCWDACREALSTNELAVVQTNHPCSTGVIILTRLMHSSGEWIAGELYVPVQKLDAQGIGSGITYARRYALAAIVGIAPDDDDGNAAVAPAAKQDKSSAIDIETAIGIVGDIGGLTMIYNAMQTNVTLSAEDRARLKEMCSAKRKTIEGVKR